MSETSHPTHHRTTNPYESLFGYSRGIRKGPFIFISGTTSVATSDRLPDLTSESSDPIILYPDSAYDQARHIFRTIIESIEFLGGKREDITRVRMFVRSDTDSGFVGRALKDSLGDVAPAATMITGSGFVNPQMKVEIEADAVVL